MTFPWRSAGAGVGLQALTFALLETPIRPMWLSMAMGLAGFVLFAVAVVVPIVMSRAAPLRQLVSLALLLTLTAPLLFLLFVWIGYGSGELWRALHIARYWIALGVLMAIAGGLYGLAVLIAYLRARSHRPRAS